VTPDEWAEYKRRLAIREQRRRDVEAELEWTEAPGRVWWFDWEGR